MFKLNLRIAFLISVILLCTFSTTFSAKYQCSISSYGQLCTISGLKLTRSDYKIEPQAANLGAITKLQLSGTVPILSSGICEVMPNLLRFDADSVSMEVIEEYAFQACKKVTFLNLSYNKFVKMGKNTFMGLSALEQLWFYDGNVPILDLNLTDLKKLTHLGLRKLNITVFPPDMIREQTNLKELYLYSNNLFDLDIERILKYTPNLQEIYLADNNFKCSRLKEILTVLKSKSIKTQTGARTLRTRYYPPNNIDGIHCLSDHQWVAELLKDASLTESDPFFEHLKTIPLGQSIEKMMSKIDYNSATIHTVETEINEKLTALGNNHQALEKTHNTDFSNLQLHLDNLQKKSNDVQEGNAENFYKLQENVSKSSEMVNRKIEDLIEKFNVNQNSLASQQNEQLRNLSQLIENLKAELTQIEQQRQTVDNTQDIHQISLWSFAAVIFFLVIIIVACLIKAKFTKPSSNVGDSNVVYYTK